MVLMSSHVGPSSSSPSTPPTWSSLFGNQGSSCSDGQLEFFEVDKEVDVMDVPSDILEEGVELWKDHLMGFFANKRLHFPVAKRNSTHIFSPNCISLFNATNQSDIKTIVLALTLTLVDLCHHAQESEVKGKPRIGSKQCARKKQRLDYAKVCIEVPINANFPDCLRFNLGKGVIADVGVEYLWIPSTCSLCKKLGHKDTTCSSIRVPRTSAPTNRNVNAMKNEGQVEPRQQQTTWVRRLAIATTVTPINGKITETIPIVNEIPEIMNQEQGTTSTAKEKEQQKNPLAIVVARER
ncbi:hypothetical protein IFM89_036848, partial [Coptis chinensis]